jgi:S-adenosylmethionine synthetase
MPLLTSESVTNGHPDKIADQISDAILDHCLSADRGSRVACETMVCTKEVIIRGEITSAADLTHPTLHSLIRRCIRQIGYTDPSLGFSADDVRIDIQLHTQSADIAQGMDHGSWETLGAGDQGMMYGYATDETTANMPMPIFLAHQLTRALQYARASGALPFLRPDGKAQVTVEYDASCTPHRVDAILVSAQHAADVSEDALHAGIRSLIERTIGIPLRDSDTRILINPTGRFVAGGPAADVGLTGRKIIVDTYGGIGRHGGGAFSGKDPTKVDRSGAYAARWLSKHVIRAGFAKRCEVQLAYAIGRAALVSLHVDTFGTGTCDDARIAALLRDTFDLRPGVIIRDLGLLDVRYLPFASGGHMGREDLRAPWEQTGRVDRLRAAAATSTIATITH